MTPYNLHETGFLSDETGLFGLFTGTDGAVPGEVKFSMNPADAFKQGVVTLRHWSPALKNMRFQKVPSTYQDKVLYAHSFLKHGGDILVFQEFVNREKKTAYLFYRRFDPISLKPKGELVNIADVPAKSRQNFGSFKFVQSEEANRLLLVTLPMHDKSVNKESYTLSVFDTAMEQQWKQRAELTFEDDRFTVAMAAVDEQGRVFVLGQEFLEGKAGYPDEKDPFQYWLIGYDETGNEIQQRKIGQQNQHLSKGSMLINQAGELVFMSAFSAEDQQSIKGIFIEVIDPASLQTQQQFTRSIPSQDLQRFMTKKERKSGGELEKV
ncbi:MAG: hypothetical protein AAF399_15345, partial [Bacteroidota bacterium]